MKANLNKSYYKGITITKIIKIIWTCLLVSLVIHSKTCEENLGIIIDFLIINIMCVLYFVIRRIYIKNNINKMNAKMTEYSKKILHKHSIYICIYIFAIVGISILMIYIKIKYNNNLEIWYWFAVQLAMMYSDAVHLSSVTAFGNNAYCSGDYIIKYDSITNCNVVCEKVTRFGEIIVIKLYNNTTQVGYDKFFRDEYHLFRLKIFQTRN